MGDFVLRFLESWGKLLRKPYDAERRQHMILDWESNDPKDPVFFQPDWTMTRRNGPVARHLRVYQQDPHGNWWVARWTKFYESVATSLWDRTSDFGSWASRLLKELPEADIAAVMMLKMAALGSDAFLDYQPVRPLGIVLYYRSTVLYIVLPTRWRKENEISEPKLTTSQPEAI
jgi:hypothetical protein